MSQQSVNSLLVGLLEEQAALIQRQIQRLKSSDGTTAVPVSSSSTAAAETSKKGSDGSKKKVKEPIDPNKPKRPLSGYQLFMADHTNKHKEANPGISQTDLMSAVAKMWKEVSHDVKEKYMANADKLKHAYDVAIANYNAKNGIGSSSSSSTPPAVVSTAVAASPQPAKKPAATSSRTPVTTIVPPPAPAVLSVHSDDKKEKKKKHHHGGEAEGVAEEKKSHKKHKKDKNDNLLQLSQV